MKAWVAGCIAAVLLSSGVKFSNNPSSYRTSRETHGHDASPPKRCELDWPHAHTVLLNFSGDEAPKMENIPLGKVFPFEKELAKMDSSLMPYASDIKGEIVRLVQAAYREYSIDIRSSDDKALSRTQCTSNVYFGSPDSLHSFMIVRNDLMNMLGASEKVDILNYRHDDNAIVYLPSFRTWFSEFRPSWRDYSQLMALVAVHEIGHLMGLEHGSDSFSIMQPASFETRELLYKNRSRCEFMRELFHIQPSKDRQIFQDAPAYLERALGLAHKNVSKKEK